MELYLIRHAEALAVGECGIATDEERPLSENGQAHAHAAAKALLQRNIILDKICTSPLVRARQTAEILLQDWAKPDTLLETCSELKPNSKLRKLSKYLLKQGSEKIALVGHMPHLGHFAAWLLGSKKVQIEFAKAGVALITCDDVPSKSQGTLQWIVTPDWY